MTHLVDVFFDLDGIAFIGNALRQTFTALEAIESVVFAGQSITLPAEIGGDYLARPVTLEDIEAAVGLFNCYSQWQTGKNQASVEDTLLEWQEPGYALDDSTLAVWDRQGEIAGYIEFYDKGAPHNLLFCWGLVHPEHQGRGLGGFLLDWSVQRAQRNIALAPEGARVVLHHSVLSTNQEAARLLNSRGFYHVRSYYHMRIDLDQPPVQPRLPEGITIRSIARGEERLAVQTVYDSFHDHWGFTEEPFEQYFQRWNHRLENDTKYDPSLYFIAMDGDEVAGVVLCYDHLEMDPEMAWVGSLGVRRAWRKRGLGTALLQHAFNVFYQRGKPRAGLGVDSSSLTGAVRLYEKAGMYTFRTYHAYELELRAGEDLMTQQVEE